MPTVVTVTPNPALDITVTLPELSPGASHRVPGMIRRLGGKGINVGSVVAEQGGSAVALGPAARVSLAEFEAHCSAGTGDPLPPGLRLNLVDTPIPLRSTVAVHQARPNITSIINERGHTHPAEVFSALVESVVAELSNDTDCVVTFSGSVPPGAPTELVQWIAAVCADRAVPFIVDTYGPPLRQACEHGATIVTPNAAEVTSTTGIGNVPDAARQLLQWGAQMVVVTLGANGIYAVESSRPDHPGIHARLAHSLNGNPTGAGDALTAALATALAEGESLSESLTQILTKAVCWSAAAVEHPAAGRIGSGTDRFLSDIRITEGLDHVSD